MKLFEGGEQRTLARVVWRLLPNIWKRHTKNTEVLLKCKISKHRPDAGAALMVHGNDFWLFARTVGPYTPRIKQPERCFAQETRHRVFFLFSKDNLIFFFTMNHVLFSISSLYQI